MDIIGGASALIDSFPSMDSFSSDSIWICCIFLLLTDAQTIIMSIRSSLLNVGFSLLDDACKFGNTHHLTSFCPLVTPPPKKSTNVSLLTPQPPSHPSFYLLKTKRLFEEPPGDKPSTTPRHMLTKRHPVTSIKLLKFN